MNKITDFVHLHTHTAYSFYESTISVRNLVDATKKAGMSAIAITDHGGLFGAMDFFRECMRSSVKPVLGMEVFVSPDLLNAKITKQSFNHLILLAENEVGWKNLMALSSIGYLACASKIPFINMTVLGDHSTGLIASSAGMNGAIPRALRAGERDLAKKFALDYATIFGERSFFLEVFNHGNDGDALIVEGLISLGQELGIGLVASNNVRYIKPEHAATLEVLHCIRDKTTHDAASSLPSRERYLKSPQEMAALFPNLPEALKNTVEIACRCEVSIENREWVPVSRIPEGFASGADYLKNLAEEKLGEKYSRVTRELQERLEYELSVICTAEPAGSYADYLLFINEFVGFAANVDIMTCVRGTAAGSLVAYLLGITDVDPIGTGLLFERFINPENPCLPYIPIDVPHEDPFKMVEFAIMHFGVRHVCEPCDFKRLNSRQAVCEAARVLNIPVEKATMLAGMINERNLYWSLRDDEKIKRTIASNDLYREVFNHALLLEGLALAPVFPSTTTIAVSSEEILRRAPLISARSISNSPLGLHFETACVGSTRDRILSQFNQYAMESTGMFTLEVAGQRDLTLQQRVLECISSKPGRCLDISALPDDDSETLDLFRSGHTEGVFQFDDPELQHYLRQFSSVTFNDLLVLTSLFRPGPMEFIDQYILRRNGKELITFPHPALEDILAPTMGFVLFQEQVMRIAERLGGLTLGSADLLRRAVGKKAAEAIMQFEEQFLQGAAGMGIKKSTASKVFDLLKESGPFAFNQSHAMLQTKISYRSGFLKAHYPEEFMEGVKIVFPDKYTFDK